LSDGHRFEARRVVDGGELKAVSNEGGSDLDPGVQSASKMVFALDDEGLLLVAEASVADQPGDVLDAGVLEAGEHGRRRPGIRISGFGE
jgi:hypothetical protein